MRRVATWLLLIYFLLITVICISAKSLKNTEDTKPKEIEKRSIFGLSAFVLSLLNSILAISLNTSINRQNAEFGGIVGG